MYRGFLYNSVVAAHRLRNFGSKADVVVLIQISVETKETSLPEEDEKRRSAHDIRIRYLPKFANRQLEGVYTVQIEKFRILDPTVTIVGFFSSTVMSRSSAPWTIFLSCQNPMLDQLL